MSINLAHNPGFENGLEGWAITGTPQVVQAEAMSGSNCLKFVNGGSIYSDEGYEFTTSPGLVWELSGWFKNENYVGPGGLRIQKQLRDGSWTDASSHTVDNTPTGWKKYTITYTSGSDAVKVRARAAFAGSGVIYLDNVDWYQGIRSLPVPQEGDRQLPYHHVIHGGLKHLRTLETSTDNSVLKTVESQTVAGTKTFSDTLQVPSLEWIPIDNWNMEADEAWTLNPGVREFSSTYSHSGSRSLKMAGISSINDSTNGQLIPVKSGEILYAECWVKWEDLAPSGTNTAISLGATIIRTAGGNTYPSFWNISASSIESTRENWIKLSGEFSVQDDGDFMVRPSVRQGAASGAVYFDEIRVAKVSPSTAPMTPSRAHVDLWAGNYEDQVVPGLEVSLVNQDFEGAGGWATSSVRRFDSSRSFEGTSSYMLDSVGGATVGEATSENYQDVSAGEVWYAEAYMWWEDIVWTSDQGPRIEFSIHNSSDVQISVLPVAGPSIAQCAVDSTGWVKFSGYVTMPANSVKLRPRCSIREGTQEGGHVWFDRYRLRKVANQSSLYFRGDKTWQPLNKTVVGLSNVNNTSDAARPISTAQQTALNTKQDLIEPVMGGGFEDDFYGWRVNSNMTISSEFTRTGGKSAKYTGGAGYGEIFTDPFVLTNGQTFVLSGYIYHPGAATNNGFRIQARRLSDGIWEDVASSASNQSGVWEYESINHTFNSSIHDAVRARVAFSSDHTAYVDDVLITIDGVPHSPAGVPQTGHYFRGDKAWSELNKSAVGLPNVDNTSDLGKPISSAQQTALDAKQNSIQAGETFQYFRGGKTWATLNAAAAGLGNVNNTSDLGKPVSTATQNALNLKANNADVVKLTGAQTITGSKTFSASPKMGGTTTTGYVMKATDTSGNWSWQPIGTLVTTVDWDNVQNKPATFAPQIGTTSTTAAAGNHTHTKADIGLGNVDNTSDANKPVSTAVQNVLDTQTPTSRTIATSSQLTGGGPLSGDLTLAIANGGVDIAELSSNSKKNSIAYFQTLDTRAVGYGQIEDGIALQQPFTITAIRYKMGTADASGTTTCHIRKNGVEVAGTSGTAAVSPTAVTGTWSFAAGDVLSVYTSAVGTTPGKRLRADIDIVIA